MNNTKSNTKNIKKKEKKREDLELKLRDWILKRKKNKIRINIKSSNERISLYIIYIFYFL
jgi:hypothetical protein